MFHTIVCDLLGIRYPILQGAMQGGGGAELVAAVSEAGGLGVLPTFGGTDAKLRADIAAVRSRTAKPFGVNIMPMGRGIAERCAATCIELGVPIVTTGRADPGERLVHQIQRIPQQADLTKQLKDPGVWEAVASGALAVPLVLIVALYLVADGPRVYAWLLAYVPRKHRPRMAQTASEVAGVVHAYVRGQLITSGLVAVFSYVSLKVLGVQAPLALALLAGVFDVVPFIGFIAFTVPAVLMALTVSPTAALIVLVLYAGYHLLENYFIVPRVYGRQMRLSTLTVLISLGVGGALSGVIGAILRPLRQARGEGREAFRDQRAHQGISGEPRVAILAAAGAFGERHDAPGRAVPVDHARGFTGLRLDQHQFGRAAADIEDEGRAVARLDQRVAAEHRQPCFLLGRDDVEMDAGLGISARDEVRAVGRLAAGLGGDRAGERDVAPLQFVGADAQRGDGAVDRRIAQPPGGGEPFAEPHDAREGVDHREPLALWPRDQQAAIVGAEIERGIMARFGPAPSRWGRRTGRG